MTMPITKIGLLSRTNWARPVATLLLPIYLAVSTPLTVAASTPASRPSVSAIQPPKEQIKPVLTRKNVKINKKKPKVIQPTGVLNFSASPKTREITRSTVLADALVPAGPVTMAENKDLARALMAYQKRDTLAKRDDLSALNAFVEQHPQSSWNVSLLLNMGMAAYQHGYFSQAFAYWQMAWDRGKGLKDPAIKAQVDRAFAELVRMHARIGNMDDLERLFVELGNRSLTGSATEIVSLARQGLWMMKNEPGKSFRCGPFALASIYLDQDKKRSFPQAVMDSASTQKGFALSEVLDLAGKLRLNMQAVKWEDPAQTLPLPCVIHWKVGHYAAVLREENNLWLVRDPTFGSDLWVTRDVLQKESSGYFLIPSGKLLSGWRKAAPNETSNIYGKGNTGGGDPNCPTPGGIKCGGGGGGCDGMAVAQVSAMSVSLNLEDIPIGYNPPKGPAVNFHLTYNQREGNQPAIFTYSNIGPKWTYNWLSFVIDDPTATSANVKIFTQGGGAYSFKNFDSGTQSFDLELKTQSILKRTSTTSYELSFKDGSKQIFNLSNGATGAGRRVFLTEETDAAGNSIEYTYDGSYRLVSVTDALGQVTTLDYDDPHNDKLITSVTDPFNREARLEYDPTGRLKKITDVIGITSEFVYGTNDFITSLTTPYGVTSFETGESGTTRWINWWDPQGDQQRVEFRHEASGIASTDGSSTVPSGQDLTNNYMQFRNTFYWDKKAWRMAPGDYTKAKIYHFLHMYGDVNTTSEILESIKNPYENRLWFKYDGQASSIYVGTSGQPSKVMRNLDGGTSEPQIIQYTYNSLGNVTTMTDPLGRETTYVYDTNNIDLLEVRQTTGTINELLAAYTYDSNHRPLTVTDAAGQTTTYTYNASGQVLTATNALTEVTTYSYDTDGYLQSIDGPVSGAGDSTSFTYDSFGRIQTVTDSEGYVLTYDYDDFDRITKITHPDSTFEQVIYNRLDAEWTRDREGRWSRSLHNKIRQVAATQDALGRTTNYEWCKCGRLQGLTDPMGRVTRWSYDERGRLLSKTFPDNTQQTYTYETSIVRLKSMTDALGQKTNYEYFADSKLKKISYTDTGGSPLSPATPSVEFTYDAEYGRLSSMVDGIGTTAYAYHVISSTPGLGAGRLAMINGPLTDDTLVYAYDELGRLSGKSLNSVAEIYDYDELGRTTEVVNPLGTFDYAYVNHTGRPDIITNPNGQTTTFDYYNNAGDQRLRQILHQTSTPDLISQFDYEYSATGNISKWTQTLGSATAQAWSITQDAADQLVNIQARESSTLVKEFAYRYDKAGNRVTEQVNNTVTTSSHNNLNQLTGQSAGGWMRFEGTLSEPATVTVDGNPATVDGANAFVGYAEVSPGSNSIDIVATDASSNVKTNTYSVTVSGGSRTLTYDLNGNMTNNGDGQTYSWDAANRMTKITYTDTSTTEFTYDGYGRRVRILEKNSGGSTTSDKRYVWSDGNQPCEERNSAGDTVVRHFYAQGVYIPAASSPADKLFYTRDHLGSIRDLVDDSESTVASYSYDPWGRRTKISGSADADFGYTGHFQHATSELTLTWFRPYDAKLGRWLSRDPIAESGGINLYGYVANNPVNLWDPTGESAIGKVLVYGIKGANKLRKWVGKSEAIGLLKEGEDIACKTRNGARDVAKGASEKGKKPIFEVDNATGNPHYHPNPRTGGHTTWQSKGRSIVGGVTLSHWADGQGQAAETAAFIGDFFNPLSIGQDIVDIGDELSGGSDGGASGGSCEKKCD